MLKTKKLLPKNAAANQVVVTMREAASNVLSANLNVIHVARDQGKRVWAAIGATAGELVAENLRLLKVTVAAANDKSVQTWEVVEQVLDARVMPVLDKVGLAAPAQYGGLEPISVGIVPRAGWRWDAMRGGGSAAWHMPCKRPTTWQRAQRQPALRVETRIGACGVAALANGTTIGCALRLASIRSWSQRGA
jgi:hypothetical protein